MLGAIQTKVLNFIIQRAQAFAATCDHSREVVGTTGTPIYMELMCSNRASWANALDPTLEDWSAAFDVVDNPYPWNDPARVNVSPSDAVWQLRK